MEISWFQSTRPRGARLNAASGLSINRVFQSTRPRGARHAALSRLKRVRLFQSTRPRGARPMLTASSMPDSGFNPRAREGRDARSCYRRINGVTVSIHAPARGATAADQPQPAPRPTVSIHAPARGATADQPQPAPRPTVSIHAPARGATSTRHPVYPLTVSFNPRAREGRDTGKLGIDW